VREVFGSEAPKGKIRPTPRQCHEGGYTLKTIVVRGKKDETTLDVGKAQFKGNVKEEDEVTRTYAKKDGMMVASSVVKAGAEKEIQSRLTMCEAHKAASAKSEEGNTKNQRRIV